MEHGSSPSPPRPPTHFEEYQRGYEDGYRKGLAPTPPDALREAYLAGVRRGTSDGMEGYPMVADDWIAALKETK